MLPCLCGCCGQPADHQHLLCVCVCLRCSPHNAIKDNKRRRMLCTVSTPLAQLMCCHSMHWAYQAHMQSWCLLIRWRQCCGMRLPNRFIDVPHCLSASAPKPVSRLAKTLPHHDAQPSYCQKLKISSESRVENQFSDPKGAVIVKCCQLSQLRTIRHAALLAWMLRPRQQITNICCACACV